MVLFRKNEEKENYIKVHAAESKSWFRDYLLVVVVIALLILFSVLNPHFISISNIFSILRYSSILGLIALGNLIIAVIGDIDLSGASIANFMQLIAIMFLVNNMNNLLVIIVSCILLSVFISLVNAFFVVVTKLPAFIMTLGMQELLLGLFRVITRGSGLLYPSNIPASFAFVGRYDLANILPVPVVILVIASIIIILLLDHSPLGRKLYAVGSNPVASQHAGIKVGYVKYVGFIISGILYGIAGVIMASTFGSASYDMASAYFFPALISVFLGATFLSLNVVNTKGTLLSAILLAIIINGFTIINLAFYWRYIVQGLILIFAVGAMSMAGIKRKNASSEPIIGDSNIK